MSIIFSNIQHRAETNVTCSNTWKISTGLFVGNETSTFCAKNSNVIFCRAVGGGGDGVKNGRGKHRISAAGCASMRRVVFSIKASRLTLDNLRTPDIHHEVKSATNRVAQRFP